MSKVNKLIDYGLLLLIGLITITWFRGDFLIDHGDQFFPISPVEDFKRYSLYSSWCHLWAIGYPLGGGIAGFFYYIFPLITKLGVSLVTSEKLLYYFIFSLAGVSVYTLVDSLDLANKRLVGLTAALAYLFNFYPLFSFWSSLIALAFFYASAPLLLAFYIKLLATGKKRYFFGWLLVATFIFSPATVNPGYIIVLGFIHLLYLVFHNLFSSNKKTAKQSLGLSITLFIFWLLFNVWWILPAISNITRAFIGSGAASAAGSVGILQDISLFTSFLNLFRFFGPWTFYSHLVGDPYFPWNEIYFSLFFIILSFLGPIIALLALLKKRKSPYLLYFGFLFVSGLFLMKGVHQPFEAINRFIVLKIPYFTVFRNSYEKFGVVALLGYSVLVGFGFGYLFQFLKRRLKNSFFSALILLSLCFLMFGLYMWPFWTGDLIYGGGQIKPGARIRIPQFYYQAQEWLKTKKNEFRLLSLPHQDGVAYRWEHGYVGSDDPIMHLFQRPIITTFDPRDNLMRPYLELLFVIFQESNQQEQLYLAAISNIKYILVHHDLIYEINTPQPEITTEKVEDILASNKNIQKEASFGKIDFYQIPEEYFLPLFYIPKKIIYISGGLDALPKPTTLADFDIRSAIFLSEKNFSGLNILPEKADELFVRGQDIEYLKLNQFSYYRLFHPSFVKEGQKENIPQININQREYQLKIPQKGNYKLFLGNLNEITAEEIKQWNIRTDDKQLDLEKISINQENNWFDLGILPFINEKEKIIIRFPSLPNNIDSKDWQLYQEDNRITEKEITELQRNNKVFYKPIINWQPNSWYQISGLIQTINKPIRLLIAEEVKDWSKNEYLTLLNTDQAIVIQSKRKEKFEFYFKSHSQAIAAKILLIEGPEAIEDLKVTPLWQPDVFLKLTDASDENKVSTDSGSFPKITFTQINPTKYKLQIEEAKEPYVLVFSETSHPGWQLFLNKKSNKEYLTEEIVASYFKEEIKENKPQDIFLRLDTFETWKKEPLALNKHYLVNGYANSWYIDPEDVDNQESYELIVEFAPQRLAYWGFFISGIAFIGSSLYLFLSLLFNLKIKKQ